MSNQKSKNKDPQKTISDSIRLNIVWIVFALCFLALILNVSYLAVTGKHAISGQDIRGSNYAKGRGMSKVTLYARRGNIYSSEQEALATSVTSYKLIVFLNQDRTTYEDVETDEPLLDKNGNPVTNKDTGEVVYKVKRVEMPRYVTDPEAYASALAPILGMDQERLAYLLNLHNYGDEPKNWPYQIELGVYGTNLSFSQKNKIEALNLPGLEFTEVIQRNHRYSSLAAHVLGFTQADEEDASKMVGVFGIEGVYNDALSGVDGSAINLIDSNGYELPDSLVEKVDSKNGQDIYLTIDTSVQREAESAMEELIERDDVAYTWAMVMEAHTGRILCMASYPSFDLNVLENTTLNYNLQYPYECGSVVKPFVYATAMDNGEYPENETYLSGNFKINGNWPVNDWWRPGWGYINYREGLVRSSNVAICNLLTKFVNEDKLRENYEKLGYWQSFDLDGLKVSAGTNHLNKEDEKYSNIDYVMTGFGQSATWTSYHLLRAYSIFANDGCIVEPYIVDYILDRDDNKRIVYQATTKKSEQIFTPETCANIRAILVDVVNDMSKGTATQYHMEDVVFAGKSGTGQIYDQTLGYDSGNFNYTIAGVAPADDPKIVIVCGIQGRENVHHGKFAEMVMSLVRSSLNSVNGYRNVGNETGNDTNYLPNFMNHTLEYSKRILQSKDITPIVIGNGTSVIHQSPTVGSQINKTSQVYLKTDGELITIPNFTTWPRKEIATYCNEAAIHVEFNSENNDGNGRALEQSIPPGTVVESGASLLIKLG